ncbi:hybrid sensor histidine kinase/response regulator [Bordetella sp. 2513F-2]
MPILSKNDTFVTAAWGLTIGIFVLDLATDAGLATWVLYLVPLLLCLRQRNANLPVAVATVQGILLLSGLFARPGTPTQILVLNSLIGVASQVAAAWLVRLVIQERARTERLLWLQRGEAEVAANMLGELDVAEVGHAMLRSVAGYLDAQVGVLYLLERGKLAYAAGYAYEPPAADTGLGLAREVARDGVPVLVRDVPPDHVRITTGTGSAAPRRLLLAPVSAEGRTLGVVELGFASLQADLERAAELMAALSETLGLSLRGALYRQHLKEALEETQRQGEELQAQQEELRVSNEELEEQGRVLRESQARLELQQAELEQSNVRLEEQTQRLERQKQALLRAQRTLEANAAELERANRHKSEFLANMSHELRTPLNSSLILAQILSDAEPGKLGPDEVRRYARTIHASNSDLLALINDILDLSKIEAGRIDVSPELVSVASVLRPLRAMFEPVAAERGLALAFEVDEEAPAAFVTDANRLQQVLKNLLSNALKFTEQGSVTLAVRGAAGDRIAFDVRDTGVGIPPEQHETVFEAFRQGDGSTSRKYGGTGLGLSISRELARILDGEIRLQSRPGAGSTFTLEVSTNLQAGTYEREESPPRDAGGEPPAVAPVPQPAFAARSGGAAETAPAPRPAQPHIDDDRDRRSRPRLVLIVEDDARFAAVLYDVAHEQGFDCLHAATALEGLELARAHRPDGILLDVSLPDQSGLSVLERIKRDPAIRHIPVHVVSAHEHVQTALELGAVGYALKPVRRDELVQAFHRVQETLQERVRRVLVVEDDAALRENIGLLLKGDDVEIVEVGTVAEALEHLSRGTFDCMVMDVSLPDASGYDLLEQMAQGGKYAFPPVIVYTGRALTRDEEQRLRRYSHSIIIKGARSPERLLDEVSLFLHRIEARLPADQQLLLRQARARDAVFEGRRILLAEDDVRNVFALSSVFEPLGARLIVTRNGREALDRLAADPDVDLVLMDLMMPEMDGLAAMREIRRQPGMADLPIIALTAKAMADDRRSCLEAGANDYIAKPIDVDKLVSLCRVWLPK